jgi:hypothetical protein
MTGLDEEEEEEEDGADEAAEVEPESSAESVADADVGGGGGGGYSDDGLPWMVDSGFAHSISVVPCQNEGNRCLRALTVDEDDDVVGSAVGGADLGGAPAVVVAVEVVELEYVPGTRAMAFRKGSVSSRSGEGRARGEMLTRAAAHRIAAAAAATSAWGTSDTEAGAGAVVMAGP